MRQNSKKNQSHHENSLNGQNGNHRTSNSSTQLIQKLQTNQQHLQDSPSLAISHFNIGKIKTSEGEYTEAIENYQESLKVLQEAQLLKSSEFARVYNSIGFIAALQNDNQKAKQYYQQTTSLDLEKGDLALPLQIKIAAESLAEIYDKENDIFNSDKFIKMAIGLGDLSLETEKILSQENMQQNNNHVTPKAQLKNQIQKKSSFQAALNKLSTDQQPITQKLEEFLNNSRPNWGIYQRILKKKKEQGENELAMEILDYLITQYINSYIEEDKSEKLMELYQEAATILLQNEKNYEKVNYYIEEAINLFDQKEGNSNMQLSILALKAKALLAQKKFSEAKTCLLKILDLKEIKQGHSSGHSNGHSSNKNIETVLALLKTYLISFAESNDFKFSDIGDLIQQTQKYLANNGEQVKMDSKIINSLFEAAQSLQKEENAQYIEALQIYEYLKEFLENSKQENELNYTKIKIQHQISECLSSQQKYKEAIKTLEITEKQIKSIQNSKSQEKVMEQDNNIQNPELLLINKIYLAKNKNKLFQYQEAIKDLEEISHDISSILDSTNPNHQKILSDYHYEFAIAFAYLDNYQISSQHIIEYLKFQQLQKEIKISAKLSEIRNQFSKSNSKENILYFTLTLFYVNELIESKQYDEGLKIINEATKLQKKINQKIKPQKLNCAQLVNLQAQIYEKMKNYEEALTYHEITLELLNPKEKPLEYIQQSLKLSEIYTRLKKVKSSLEILKRAQKLYHEHDLKSKNKENNLEIEIIYKQIQLKQSLPEFSSQLSMLYDDAIKILNIETSNKRVLKMSAQIIFDYYTLKNQEKDHKLADHLCLKAGNFYSKIDPNTLNQQEKLQYCQLLLVQANFQIKQNFYKKGIEFLDKAVSLAPHDKIFTRIMIQLKLFNCYQGLKDTEQQLVCLERIKVLVQSDTKAILQASQALDSEYLQYLYYHLGQTQFALNQDEKAAENFQLMIKMYNEGRIKALDPNKILYCFKTLGSIQVDTKKYDQAKNTYTQALIFCFKSDLNQLSFNEVNEIKVLRGKLSILHLDDRVNGEKDLNDALKVYVNANRMEENKLIIDQIYNLLKKSKYDHNEMQQLEILRKEHKIFRKKFLVDANETLEENKKKGGVSLVLGGVLIGAAGMFGFFKRQKWIDW